MNVSLSQEFEEYIVAKIGKGRYRSADEVLCDAFLLLEERDAWLAECDADEAHRDWLRSELRKGADAADRGLVRTLDAELVEEIKAKGRERVAARNGSVSVS